MRICYCFLFLCAAVVATAEFREFTSPNGQKLEAAVLEVEDDKVKLRLKDGRVITTPQSAFSRADQIYLRRWALIEQSKANLFEVEVDKIKTGQKTDTISYSVPGGKLPQHIVEWDAHFSITLTNQTAGTMTGLVCEYKYFVQSITRNLTGGGGEAAREYQTESELISTKGAMPLEAMPAGGSLTFETAKVTMREATLSGETRDGGQTWTYDSSFQSRLSGLWLRIKQGENVIFEWVKPESLKETETF